MHPGVPAAQNGGFPPPWNPALHPQCLTISPGPFAPGFATVPQGHGYRVPSGAHSQTQAVGQVLVQQQVQPSQGVVKPPCHPQLQLQAALLQPPHPQQQVQQVQSFSLSIPPAIQEQVTQLVRQEVQRQVGLLSHVAQGAQTASLQRRIWELEQENEQLRRRGE
ncbi:hypothetical protein CNMCM8980_005996 [Aspergillus fumigatiaffinis]|nr:hypothetical protein CNMCM8980_005996 [Aspergillus fumigatiaffinis]